MIFNNNIPRCLFVKNYSENDKEELLEEVKTKLNIEIYKIETISKELLDELLLCPIKYICVFDSCELDYKKQNLLLKFLEEYKGYSILFNREDLELLPTILSRISTLYFSFNKDFSRSLNLHSSLSEDELDKLCDLILNNITKASLQNTLTLTNRIEPDKEQNMNIFLNKMYFKAIELKLLEESLFIKKYIENLNRFKNLNKTIYTDNFLIELRELMVNKK